MSQSSIKWDRVMVRNLCRQIQYGFTASASSEPKGVKFLRITDIVPENIDWNTVPYCDIKLNEQGKYLLQAGDIVIARTGATTGYAKYIKSGPPCIFASYLVRIHFNDNVCNRYAGFVIESELYKRYIQAQMGGTAQPNANAQILTSFLLPLPPLPTQRKIATILSAYDDLIENNLRRIKVLEGIAQNLYTEWFVRFHFPGHRHIRFIDSLPGRIPEGWKKVKLGNLLEIRKGKNITKKTITKGKVPVVAGGLTPAYYHSQANTYHPVVTISASGANAGFVKLYQEDIWASDCSYIDKSITSFVYFYYLFFKFNQVSVTRLQRGSAQPHVYPKDLMELQMMEVPRKILEGFERDIAPFFEMIKNCSIRNRNLRRTRDLLLPRLISGELDVSDLDIKSGNDE